MVKVALCVQLDEAKPCKESEVESFLKGGLAVGRVAAALMAKAGDLLAKPPAIEKIDVLAAKLPG